MSEDYKTVRFNYWYPLLVWLTSVSLASFFIFILMLITRGYPEIAFLFFNASIVESYLIFPVYFLLFLFLTHFYISRSIKIKFVFCTISLLVCFFILIGVSSSSDFWFNPDFLLFCLIYTISIIGSSFVYPILRSKK